MVWMMKVCSGVTWPPVTRFNTTVEGTDGAAAAGVESAAG
jgi:hypothetical protein